MAEYDYDVELMVDRYQGFIDSFFMRPTKRAIKDEKEARAYMPMMYSGI
jgi:hypothetical protein